MTGRVTTQRQQRRRAGLCVDCGQRSLTDAPRCSTHQVLAQRRAATRIARRAWRTQNKARA